ncbi:MAG: MBL fold metallo-hydrolase [Defluviitaleaceae bacterium]|nr:MBL fold metallo-hydrolase [Defluviitaleaceae bacterium]
MENAFELTFLGTNGSCSYNNGKRVRYGSNSSCIAASVGGETLIFDTGTGICGFKDLLNYQRDHINIFYSHYHADHLRGLLFFPFLYDEKNVLDVYGHDAEHNDVRKVIEKLLTFPHHPVGLSSFSAKIEFHSIEPKAVFSLSPKILVKTYPLSHGSIGSVGYRVEYGGKVFCYCTDVELSKHENDTGLLEFMRDADLLVIDSYFDDGKVIGNWGHSSWRECAEWAKQANAKKLALFHHRFEICDDELDEIEKKAQEVFKGAFTAADFMKITL